MFLKALVGCGLLFISFPHSILSKEADFYLRHEIPPFSDAMYGNGEEKEAMERMALGQQYEKSLNEAYVSKLEPILDLLNIYLKELPLGSKRAEIFDNVLRLQESLRGSENNREFKSTYYEANNAYQSNAFIRFEIPIPKNPICRKAFKNLIEIVKDTQSKLSQSYMCRDDEPIFNEEEYIIKDSTVNSDQNFYDTTTFDESIYDVPMQPGTREKQNKLDDFMKILKNYTTNYKMYNRDNSASEPLHTDDYSTFTNFLLSKDKQSHHNFHPSEIENTEIKKEILQDDTKEQQNNIDDILKIQTSYRTNDYATGYDNSESVVSSISDNDLLKTYIPNKNNQVGFQPFKIISTKNSKKSALEDIMKRYKPDIYSNDNENIVYPEPLSSDLYSLLINNPQYNNNQVKYEDYKINANKISEQGSQADSKEYKNKIDDISKILIGYNPHYLAAENNNAGSVVTSNKKLYSMLLNYLSKKYNENQPSHIKPAHILTQTPKDDVLSFLKAENNYFNPGPGFDIHKVKSSNSDNSQFISKSTNSDLNLKDPMTAGIETEISNDLSYKYSNDIATKLKHATALASDINKNRQINQYFNNINNNKIYDKTGLSTKGQPDHDTFEFKIKNSDMQEHHPLIFLQDHYYSKQLEDSPVNDKFSELVHSLPDGTNLYKLKSTPKQIGVVELTYLLKRPNQLINQSFYYVKYRLPYEYFILNLKKLLTEQPLMKRSHEELFRNLIGLFYVSDISQDLKSIEKNGLITMILKNGTLVHTTLLPEETVNVNLEEMLPNLSPNKYELPQGPQQTYGDLFDNTRRRLTSENGKADTVKQDNDLTNKNDIRIDEKTPVTDDSNNEELSTKNLGVLPLHNNEQSSNQTSNNPLK